MQEIWSMLLSSEEFMEAYTKGLVILCGDGHWRRLFPRFFAYLADYVERYDHSLIDHRFRSSL
jgi:hypothetical protein